MQPINNNFETTRGVITIRESAPSDLMQYRELRLGALLDSPTAFSADYELNLNQPMSFWEGRVKPDEHGKLFVAEHASQLIGMTGIHRRESPKTKHGADIFSVFVRPEWRGLHIAEALMDQCVQWAKAQGLNILKLGVTTSNTTAVRFYERCGFKIYGTEPRDIFYEGNYYDLYLMARELA
jgi:ribosomal protein S18 acetylase RimI-like enzyme